MITQHMISLYSQQFGSFLIMLLGVFFFSKRSLPVKILVIYGLNSFTFQLIANALIYTKRTGYLNFNGNLYTLFEALILLAFFYTLFETSLQKKIAATLAILYVVLFFVLVKDNWSTLFSSIKIVRDLFVIVCALVYFYLLLTVMPTTEISKYPMFWIVTAMLFFFAGTFALSVSLDYLVKTLRNDVALLWTARNYFRFLFCLVVCYGLWLDLKQVRVEATVAK